MRALVSACLCLLSAASLGEPAHGGTRLKDIIDVEGVRDNQLIGYGIVFGLNGTGDSLRNCAMLQQSLESMLERLGINTRDATLNTKNAAAVMVTANLPPFAANGTRIDVTVSAVCDSQSLEGGTLLATPLLGADGEVYAVSQGPVAIAGFSAEGDASKITRGVPTVGRIANGGVAMRVVLHGLPNSIGHLVKAPVLHFIEGVQDAALHGL
jgi:flagellar P-ring protein precursor FlgI